MNSCIKLYGESFTKLNGIDRNNSKSKYSTGSSTAQLIDNSYR